MGHPQSINKWNHLIGKQFTYWTVLSVERGRHSQVWANCECVCGVQRKIRYDGLRDGTSASCGCKPYDRDRLPQGEVGLRNVYRQFARNAKDRDLSFELSIEDVRTLTSKNCTYCDAPPSARNTPAGNSTIETKSFQSYVYNGLDRVDSDQGYILSNVVPCCRRCNVAKNDMLLDEFRSQVEKIYKHLFGSK